MKEKIAAQTRMDPGVSLMVDGGGPEPSARAAEESNRISGQEFTEGEECTFSDLAHKAKVRGLEA